MRELRRDGRGPASDEVPELREAVMAEPKLCNVCDGDGVCRVCWGTGGIYVRGDYVPCRKTCARCDGRGKV